MSDYRSYRTWSRVDTPPACTDTLPEPDASVGTASLRRGTFVTERWADEYREWRVEAVVATPESDEYDNFAAILKSGDHRMIADADDLGRRVAAPDSRWMGHNPYRRGKDGLGPYPDGTFPRNGVVASVYDTVPAGWTRSYSPLDRRFAPTDARDYDVRQLSGRGSRIRANKFLSGEDGLVDPSKGEVPGWKACFGAFGPKDTLAAIAVVGRPHARPIDNGDAIELYRLAAHPIAASGTNSHLIGAVRSWSERQGYDRLLTYANLDKQDGTCYAAAGLELEDVTEADPEGWKDHDEDRKKTEPEPWTRGRFEVAL